MNANSTFDRELRELLAVVEEHLPRLQEAFKRYQQTGFEVRSREFFSLELCGEAGELANLEKKRWRGQNIEIGHFSEEAADVFIALMNYCNATGTTLSKAVGQKVATIRPTKTG